MLSLGVNFVIDTNVIDKTMKLIIANIRFNKIIYVGSKIKGIDST